MKYILLALVFCCNYSIFGQDTLSSNDEESMIGQRIPSFSGTSTTDFYWNNDSLSGKVAVINFWFIGCLPCMKEIPFFNDLDSIFNDDQFVLLSIAPHVREDVLLFNSDSVNNFSRVRKYFARQKIAYQVIPSCTNRTITNMEGEHNSVGPDCKLIAEDFHVRGYPATFVIDKKGIIRFVHVGFVVNMDDITADADQGTEMVNEIRLLLSED